MKTRRRIIKDYFLYAMCLLLILVLPYLHNLQTHDPFATNLKCAKLPPGTEGYLFGTDNLGRCVLCRILEGGTTSVYAALVVVITVLILGTLLGLLAGFCGGVVDLVISKIILIFQAFPSFILAIAVAGTLGQGIQNGILALCAVYWTTYARISRSMVISLREADYIKAARLCGAKTPAILRKYLLPGVLGQMLVTATLDVGNVILSMASLSFLGLGAKRPTAEWGAMMSEASDYLQKCPWILIFPGLALFLVVIMFNLCGDSLRDRLDPR